MKHDKELVKEQFLEDTKDHKIEIKHWCDVYRHIVCSNGSLIMHFSITTYPGYLAINGDMGHYVFFHSQLDDMFKFFRRDGLDDPGYWAEKCKAEDSRSGVSEFSCCDFEEAVREHMLDTFMLGTFEYAEGETKESLVARAKSYTGHISTEQEAVEVIEEMINDEVASVDDYDMIDSSRKYSHRFLWCLYAIMFTVRKVDNVENPISL